MKTWKTAALAAALLGAAGAGAALAPAAHGQSPAPRPAAAQRALELITGGAHLGVTIKDVEEADAKMSKGQSGVVIEDVVEDGPAAKAGIRKGDVIVEFDGERVRSARQFQRLVQETPAGRTVQAALLRDGQRTTVSVAPSERDAFRVFRDGEFTWREPLRRVVPAPPAVPRTPAIPAPPAPPALRDFEGLIWSTGTSLGITTSALTEQLGEYFGTKSGVLVTSVTDGSAAEKAGVKAGDVITSLNGTDVGSPSDLRRRIQRLDDGAEFTIGVTRDRKPLTLKGKVEPRRGVRRSFRSVI